MGDRPPASLANRRIAFAANAADKQGGQGEFLNQMIRALAPIEGARVYSRFAQGPPGRCVNLPFTGTPYRWLFDAVRALPAVRVRQDWLTLLGDLDFDARLSRAIEPPDVFDGVIAQCHGTLRRLEREGRTRTILTCLNTHLDHLSRILDEEHRHLGAPRRMFLHPRMRARARREIEMADRVRVNSELARRTFVERGVPAEKVAVIQPGVDLEHFRAVPKPDDIFRVLAVSTVDARKGIYYLLRAFEEARLPASELVIVGGTGDRWSKRMLGRFLRNQGNIRQMAIDVTKVPVDETYGRASVLVHPALEDGYGLVVPQALASGRPVIVTRQSGASELVRHGVNGFVIESRDVEWLKEHLETLAHDRALWERMCEASRPSVSHLGYEAFAQNVRALYEQVLA